MKVVKVKALTRDRVNNFWDTSTPACRTERECPAIIYDLYWARYIIITISIALGARCYTNNNIILIVIHSITVSNTIVSV